MKERKKFPVLAGTIILFLVVILLGYTGRAEAAGRVRSKTQQLASTRRFTPITAEYRTCL